MLKLLIFGITGRMGKELIRSIESEDCCYQDNIIISAGICSLTDMTQEKEVFCCSKKIPVYSDFNLVQEEYDAIIDFSSVSGAEAALKCARQSKVPLVSCSTGLSASLEEDIKKAGVLIPVLRARNTSVGVNALVGLVSAAAAVLDSKWEVEIVELHHHHKKDSPSGTAITLAESICKSRGLDFNSSVSSGRAGVLDSSRNPSEIGIQAVRGGDIVGEHTVYFISEGERIELTHKATNRRIFADGALQAAIWLIKQEPGYYSMSDILGINKIA